MSRNGGDISNFITCMTPRYSAWKGGGPEVGPDGVRGCANRTILTAAKHSKTPSQYSKFKECGLRSGFLFHWMKCGVSAAFADTLESVSA